MDKLMAWLLGILISLVVSIAVLWVTVLIIVGNDGTGTDFSAIPSLSLLAILILSYLGLYTKKKEKKTNAKELSSSEE
ncbi:MAG: hypothetical protein ACFFC3_12835 [Candidatus Odinarchaeota archaeon]